MGYTHCFRKERDFSDVEWDLLTRATKKILKMEDLSGVKISRNDDGKAPVVNKNEICFNGVNDESHETFLVRKTGDTGFNFCKTAEKPYDVFVCMVLLASDDVAKGVLGIGSDGWWDVEWVNARELYKKLFGVEPVNPGISLRPIE